MSRAVIHIDVVATPINAEDVRAFVLGDPALGGICTFEGATRADTDATHGAIARLDYEAYDGMARRQMQRLAEEALEQWGPGRVAMVHRTGAVLPGEISVMIAVACGHRDGAFAACRWLIDTLKRDVPIWKRDIYEDGSKRWVDPTIGISGSKRDEA